jgi:hypothetical protein
MKIIPLTLSLVLLAPCSIFAADAATPAADTSAAPVSLPTPTTPATTAPRGGRGAGARPAALTAANNHIEVPAKGAIWTPSPNPDAIGKYPYGPDSVVHDGVPQGTMEKTVLTSQVYPGVMRRMWIYVPAQYDPKVPACLDRKSTV